MGAACNYAAGVSAAMDGYNKARIAAIDKEIEAEKKKDGKSRESLDENSTKWKCKKKQMARKAFEQQKKMKYSSYHYEYCSSSYGSICTLKFHF